MGRRESIFQAMTTGSAIQSLDFCYAAVILAAAYVHTQY